MISNAESKPNYSIIVPVYCNEGSLTELYSQIQSDVVQQNPSRSYEIIFVDDGSSDNSFNVLLELKHKNPKDIKIIKFTRNFGQLSAILAGYQHAQGEYIIFISADLQDPPKLINQMLDAHFDEGYEIVVFHRSSRDESFFRKFTSKFFYKIIQKLSFPNMPEGGFDFVSISQKVKHFILTNTEANAFFQGQILWTGYTVKFIPYHRKKRKHGVSGWSFQKKIKYLIDGVMSYSYLPMRIMSLSGIAISFLGFIYALIIIFAKFFGEVPFKGWAPLMVIILILSGIQMLMLGVIGEYLWRALDQVRNRPLYIIDEIFD